MGWSPRCIPSDWFIELLPVIHKVPWYKKTSEHVKSSRFSVFTCSWTWRSRVRLTGCWQRGVRRWSKSRGIAKGWLTPCRAPWTVKRRKDAVRIKKTMQGDINEMKIQLSQASCLDVWPQKLPQDVQEQLKVDYGSLVWWSCSQKAAPILYSTQ